MTAVPTRDRKSYSVYGATLTTGFDLDKLLPLSSKVPDLGFQCVTHPPQRGQWQEAQRIYPMEQEDPPVSIYRFEDHLGVRFADITDFDIADESIVCYLHDQRHSYLIPNQLLGMVLALWLERRGIMALHASATVVNGGAAAFMGTRGGGKTSTAAAFIAAGHPMLTEDLLPIEETGGRFMARPGYPQMRMWPEDAARFEAISDRNALYHPSSSKLWVPVGTDVFGTFCDEPRPLTCIYVLERIPDGEATVEIRPVRMVEAVMLLAAQSFLPDVLWKGTRFPLLADLAGRVPLRRLRYGSRDGSGIIDVRGPIIEDLAAL